MGLQAGGDAATAEGAHGDCSRGKGTIAAWVQGVAGGGAAVRLDEQREQLLERGRRLGRVAAAAATLDCRRGVVGENLQPLEQRAARVAAEPRGGELA
jgi:hypothetical protein